MEEEAIGIDEVGKLRFTSSFDKEPVLSETHELKTEKTTNGIILKPIKYK